MEVSRESWEAERYRGDDVLNLAAARLTPEMEASLEKIGGAIGGPVGLGNLELYKRYCGNFSLVRRVYNDLRLMGGLLYFQPTILPFKDSYEESRSPSNGFDRFIKRHRRGVMLGLLALLMLGFVAANHQYVKNAVEDLVDSDSDHDGYKNWEERAVGSDSHNPKSTPKDIDGDGLSNDEEKALGTNPLKADTDMDELSDHQEVKVYHTNPLRRDTDGDCINDYSEVKSGSDPLKKDPLRIDSDGDYISDHLEVERYGTNPLKMDTDGGGVDDFNEIYTYETDPNNPEDDREILEKIPNVNVRKWDWDDGGVITSGGDFTLMFEKIIVISMRDPLLKWYADRTEIRWLIGRIGEHHSLPPEGERIGLIYTDGKPIYRGVTRGEMPYNPSYYFTHTERRCPTCVESAIVNHVILKLKGYKCLQVIGLKRYYLSNAVYGHQWNEAYIDGHVYVVDYNTVIPRDKFYEENWEITSEDYDPEWYKKP
jgi:hypothetical protein